MVSYQHSALFVENGVDKQYIIEYDGGKLTNADLVQESFSLHESLCSEEQLTFGTCEASYIKFRYINIATQLVGKQITVKIVLNGNIADPFVLGTYKVASDKPTADRRYRDIVAYDVMHDIINLDVAGWYNALEFPMTLKAFRNSFFEFVAVEQADATLVNDDMTVEKTIEAEQISGLDVISSICEINGCFGHIDRQGKFTYVHLVSDLMGLFPKDNLYPEDVIYPKQGQSTSIPKSRYLSCQYEDFVTTRISELQIRQEEEDIGLVITRDAFPEEQGAVAVPNKYIVEDNFLVYGKGSDELSVIGNNLLDVIGSVSVYRPFSAECIGNPCLEVGDGVLLSTKYEIVAGFILERNLKGLQALRDNYSAEGVEKYTDDVNSISKSIIQLKGKSNTLERTLDYTRSEMADMGTNLNSKIEQTASQIRTEVSNSEAGLQAQITQNANGITAEVSRATESESQLSSKITQTATEIRSEVSSSNSNLQSQITQNASNIKLEVSRAQGVENSLSSRISVSEKEISLKVSSGDVVSEVNASSEAIRLTSNRLIVESTNFSLDESGNVVMTGVVKATSGQIGNFEIIDGELIGSDTQIYYNSISTGTVEATGNVQTPSIYNPDGQISIGGGNAVYFNASSVRFSANPGQSATSISDLLSRISALESTVENLQAQIDSLTTS